MANEVRPIDANALVQRLIDNGWLRCDITDSAEMIAVLAAIDDTPTIDPESLRPVGKVVLKERHRGGFCKVRGLDEYGVEHTVMVDTRSYGKEPYCSECGAALADSFQDYCPRCGAKMEG